MSSPVLNEIVQVHYIKEGRFDGIDLEVLTGVCEALEEHCALYRFDPGIKQGVLGSFIFSALTDPDIPLKLQVRTIHSVTDGRTMTRRYAFVFEGMLTSLEGSPHDVEFWAGVEYDANRMVVKLLKESGVLLEVVVD